MFSLKPLAPLNNFSQDPRRPQFLSPPRSNSPSFSPSPPKSTKSLRISPLKYQFSTENITQNGKDSAIDKEREKQSEIRGDEEKKINGIHVPRQKYISIPKAELLDAILTMFESKEDADEFVRVSV